MSTSSTRLEEPSRVDVFEAKACDMSLPRARMNQDQIAGCERLRCLRQVAAMTMHHLSLKLRYVQTVLASSSVKKHEDPCGSDAIFQTHRLTSDFLDDGNLAFDEIVDDCLSSLWRRMRAGPCPAPNG